MSRFAKTRKGRSVPLNQAKDVEGGIVSWILNRHGHAVLVFVPVA